MKSFSDILKKEFGIGVPIFTEDIAKLFPDISEVALFKRINNALDSGALKRDSRGVYYFPKYVTVLGQTKEMPLDQLFVLQKRYLFNNDDIYGYFTGLKLENDTGISPQVPGTIEIVTNKEKSRKRSIGSYAGYKDVIIRRPRIPVTKDNVKILEVVDLIDRAPLAALEDYQLKALRNKVNSVDRSEIIKVLEAFPAKTSKKFIESERLGVLT